MSSDGAAGRPPTAASARFSGAASARFPDAADPSDPSSDAPDLQLPLDIAPILDGAVRGLPDPRMLTVLKSRIFTDEPVPQADLAVALGISKPRVQQLQRGALDHLNKALEADRSSLRQLSLPPPYLAARVPDVLTAVPQLAEVIPALQDPGVEATLLDPVTALDVIAALADMTVEEGWLTASAPLRACKATVERLQAEADPYGVVPDQAVPEVKLVWGAPGEADLRDQPAVGAPPVDGPEPTAPWDSRTNPGDSRATRTAQWLQFCGVKLLSGRALLQTRSSQDYAAAVLSAEGQPLTVQQIVDRFDHEKRRNERTVANALMKDPRFHRSSKRHWALKEWGSAKYSNVRDLMRQVLEREGGPVALPELQEELATIYGVSVKTVATYAAGAPFQTVKGLVKLAEDTLPAGALRPTRPSVGQTVAGLRRVGEAWAYTIEVDQNHLRGSGTVVAPTIGEALGLQPGQHKQYASDRRPQMVSWRGAQPVIGTVRLALRDLDASEGDAVELVFGDDGRFHARKI